jgi:hypothetical protein
VIIKEFNLESIDLELSFWVQNIKEWATVKSDVILAMDEAFRENGIAIPGVEEKLNGLTTLMRQHQQKNKLATIPVKAPGMCLQYEGPEHEADSQEGLRSNHAGNLSNYSLLINRLK